MIRSINEISKPVKREIDLTGPQGNAFYLMGYAKELSKQLNIDDKVVIKKMKENNYENLIRVFDDYFGEYVDLFK